MSEESNLKEKIRPIMENMVFELVLHKPENPALFMIDYLQKTAGYTSNGITVEEKNELEQLRKDIQKYRNLEEINKKNDGDKQEEELDKSYETDEDEIDDKIETRVINAKARLSRQRDGVSAEVYGLFNKKEDFQPRVIEKNDEQIQRIKARILQSFLFSNLEPNDLKIVINSMEEKIYK